MMRVYGISQIRHGNMDINIDNKNYRNLLWEERWLDLLKLRSIGISWVGCFVLGILGWLGYVLYNGRISFLLRCAFTFD